MVWEERRSLFRLDPRSTHVNHGSFGAVPLPVQRAQQWLRDELEANPDAFFTRGLLDRLALTRARLAEFVGADPAGTALLPNATAAATAVIRSISPTQIVVTDHGYGAVLLAARATGLPCRVIDVPLLAADDEVVARVAAVAHPGTLVIVDQIASPTAKLFPVAALATAIHERGALLAVDGAHAPGMLPVDVGAIGADFWWGNLHKWAFAPRPTALLAVAEQHRASMRPLVTSWEDGAGFPVAQEYAGTLDYTAWLAAPAALHLLGRLGLDRVRSHNSRLAAQGQRLVAAAIPAAAGPGNGGPGNGDLGTGGPGNGGNGAYGELARAGTLGSDAVSMRLVPLPPGVAAQPATAFELKSRLAAEHRIEAQVVAWGGMGWLRLSAQVYNTIEDYARLADALRDLR